jgi:hypothetical protein
MTIFILRGVYQGTEQDPEIQGGLIVTEYQVLGFS